ncbi:MAG: hypothetical protein QXF24_04135, partial [Thermoproteota archaeon]
MAWPSRRIPVPNPGATALLLFLLASLPHFPKVAAAGQIEIANASTSYRIELYANRSALWQITYSVPLLDSEDVALFAQYVQNFTASKQEFVDAFEQRMAQIVEQAADLTGREMYAVNFDSCAAIVNTPTVSRGTVTY